MRTLIFSVALGWLFAVGGHSQDAPRRLNAVEPLLDDAEFVEQFVAEFPKENYQIHEVEGVGRFYLEDPDKAPPAVVDYVKDTIRRGEIWEQHVHLTMSALVEPGTVAIDVGAHIGAHTVPMSTLVGPEGKVYAFEPQLERYRHLCKNLELNECHNAVPLRYAIGDKHDIIEIAREHVHEIGSGGEQAELRTIDSFGFSNVSLIKIDVERYEDYVIAGASETIRKSRPLIIVEIQGGAAPATASPEERRRIEDTIDTLNGFEYEVVNIGGHDYLAVPKEQEASVTRKLNKAWSRRGGGDESFLVLVFVALIVVAALVAGVLLWRKRYA